MTLRYLQKLLTEEKFPFPCRKNVSAKNNKMMYEIQITDPVDQALLTHYRKHRESQKTQDASIKKRKNRIRVALPQEAVTLLATPVYLSLIEVYLKKHLIEKKHKPYHEIQLSISDDNFAAIESYAQENGIPFNRASQIVFLEAISEMRQDNNDLILKGEKINECNSNYLS